MMCPRIATTPTTRKQPKVKQQTYKIEEENHKITLLFLSRNYVYCDPIQLP